MMEVKGKKKFTGKGTKTSQEKNRFHKNNGKVAKTYFPLPLEGGGWWDEGACGSFQHLLGLELG